MKKLLNSVSVKIFITILCMVLPINIIAFCATDLAIKKTIEQVCLAKQDIANIRMADMEEKMNASTTLLSNMILKDLDAITMFLQREDKEHYTLAKLRFFAKLRNEIKMINGADGYYFYMHEKQDWLQYGTVQEKKDIMEILDFSGEEELMGWNLLESKSGSSYFIYSFSQGKVSYGAWFRTDKILNDIKQALTYEETELSFQTEPVESDYGKYWIAANAGKLYLKVCLDDREVLEDMTIYPIFSRFSVILFIFTIPLLYWAIRRLILNPMNIVRKAHQEMQTGNQNFRISEKANSTEVKNIYDSFNIMANDLQKYKFDAYEKEIARQDMEILNLQLQIRPHFLLNMFNLLYTLLLENNRDALSDIILYLSNYFRYIFREGKERSIFSKEFDMIQQYMEVAAIRYRGRVVADYEIDPKVMLIRVPPLLIHNFLENAVKYGVKEQGILHIFLEGKFENNQVSFVILDDGNGMDEETLERNRKILSGEYEPKMPEVHLGLYNSYRRLRYAYGDSVTVKLDSELQKGTRYTITFKYVLDGGEQDAAVDCK